MSSDVRVLFLADSHLGLDLPVRPPRVKRRRRGDDFLANYAAALEPARQGEVDLVVHGGDVFDRSHVPASLAYQALEPLRRLADEGMPVFVVPALQAFSVRSTGARPRRSGSAAVAVKMWHWSQRPMSFGMLKAEKSDTSAAPGIVAVPRSAP